MTPPASQRFSLLAVTFIGVAAFLAYANTFSAPFIFDDLPGIVDNHSIRHLRDLGTVLSPPPDVAGAGGRPIVNLSLALNYAFGGTDVRGYHALNLALHICAALALFGLVRRTLLQPAMAASYGPVATPLATAVAALWALHPLQTESVTCVIQRSEIIGALCYLLTLYCFARGLGAIRSDRNQHNETDTRFLAHAGGPRTWFALSFLACLAGMAGKEFVVSAPLLAILYDRTFVAGSFASAWRRRWPGYLSLAATWLLLAYLMLGSAQRGGTVGFDTGLSPWSYALTQCHALVLYLRLALWPHPLVVDYGTPVEPDVLGVLPQALLLLALLAGTVVALRRRAALGFAGAFFFAVLAPSSSFVPLATQTIAEHRMYLPLAAVLAPLVLWAHAILGKRTAFACLSVALLFGALTFRRNHDFRNAIALWSDAVVKWPRNPRLHVNLGHALAAAGRPDQAAAAYHAALEIHPNMIEALVNLGHLLSATDRAAEALPVLRKALHLKPDSAEAHVTLGAALDRLGRTDEAVREYERSLRLDPRLAQAHRNLADVLVRRQAASAALDHLEIAERLQPGSAETHDKLAVALAALGRLPDAHAAFAAARKLGTADATALQSWAIALLDAGQAAEALEHFRTVLRLRPASAEAHYNLGNALAAVEQFAEAARHYAEALRLKPDHVSAHTNLGNALLMLERPADAIPHYEQALLLKSGNANAHHNLGLALARLGRLREAVTHFETAVRLAPDYQEARQNLLRAREQLQAPP